jgi:RNA polymerase sigma factor (sigma-70 family)
MEQPSFLFLATAQTKWKECLKKLKRQERMKVKKPKEERVLDYDGMTQQEVADALGISRAAVSQIEKRAYKKFKRGLAKRLKHITDYI